MTETIAVNTYIESPKYLIFSHRPHAFIFSVAIIDIHSINDIIILSLIYDNRHTKCSFSAVLMREICQKKLVQNQYGNI